MISRITLNVNLNYLNLLGIFSRMKKSRSYVPGVWVVVFNNQAETGSGAGSRRKLLKTPDWRF